MISIYSTLTLRSFLATRSTYLPWRVNGNFCEDNCDGHTSPSTRRCVRCQEDNGPECTELGNNPMYTECNTDDDQRGIYSATVRYEEMCCPSVPKLDNGEFQSCKACTPVPKWSLWSSWEPCTKECNEGLKKKIRKCLLENDERPASECPGGKIEEEEICNTQPCQKLMELWINKYPKKGLGEFIEADVNGDFFQNLHGDDPEEKCSTFCLFNECSSMLYTVINIPSFEQDGSPIDEKHCYISLYDSFPDSDSDLDCYGTTCNLDDPNEYITSVFGIFRENAATQEFLPDNPKKSRQVVYHEINGICDEDSSTAFGEVHFRRTPNYEYHTDDEKNVIKEPKSDTYSCSSQCIEKAGCNFFYQDENNCNIIIGSATNTVENSNIVVSGQLSNVCPNSALTNGYNRRSEFLCLLDNRESVDDDAVDALGTDLIDDILTYLNMSFPMNEWSFDQATEEPLIAKSRYVDISLASRYERYAEDLHSPLDGYIWFKFTIETHTRQQISSNSKKKRSTTSNDALEELRTLEDYAVSFIMTSLIFTAEISVSFTSPVMNIYTRQVTPDGNVAADCSSGYCECSKGYIKNGNDCVEMTHEQSQEVIGCNPFLFTCDRNVLKVHLLSHRISYFS